jgi:DNA repair protein RadD
MILRDYQGVMVGEARNRMLTRVANAVILQMATGAGKTPTACEIIRLALEKGNSSLFLAHRTELLTQASDKLTAFGIPHGLIKAGRIGDMRHKVQVASVQTLVRRLDKLNFTPSLIVIDECFTGDVEILTSNGFVRFDALQGTERVAQYDNGLISFVVPDKFIKQRYAGELVRFRSDTRIDLDMTPNHDLLVKYPTGTRKVTAEKVKFNGFNYLYTAGKSSFEDSGTLTIFERFLIAVQADGNMRRTCDVGHSVGFMFSKQRKIDEFLGLMTAGNFTWTEVKPGGRGSSSSVRLRRRFLVHRLPFVSKNLWNHFDIAKMSVSKARQIIQEMVKWDGHINSESLWYYSSVVEENTNFYQCVCILAGYSSNKTIQIDNRKATFSDVHRLFIKLDRDTVGTQHIEKTLYPFDGTVYCVSVPSTNIIVRRNGKPVVIGNCHLAEAKSYKDILAKYPKAYVIGLSATPGRLDGRGLGKPKGNFDCILTGPPMMALIERGYLVPLRYFGCANPIDTSGLHSTGGDYNLGELAAAVDKPAITGDVVDHWKRIASDRKTLVFCVSIEHADHVAAQFRDAGIPALAVNGKWDAELRATAMSDFERGAIQVLVNCQLYVEGIDIPAIGCIADLAPTQSLTRYLQRAGRGMRACPGKENCIYLDHANNVSRFGFPTEPREWTLEGSESRKTSAERAATIRVCSGCFAASPARAMVCVECGKPFEVKARELEKREGELQEITPEQIARRKERQLQGRASSLAQLTEFARMKGYSERWAQHVWEARQKKRASG